ncbi:MAG: hypothetical protein ACYCST_16200 [Acidimicrobiales bacterium]
MADLPPGGQPLEPERSTRVPPPPGSAEEAAVIFDALSAQVWVSTPKKGAKPSVVVGTVLILIATVIALVIGAQYLRHVASSNAPTAVTTPGGSTACAGTAAAIGATEINLASALCAAGAYEAVHGESVQGIDGAALAQADPSLSRTVSFQALSATPDQISLALPVAGALVLTGFQPGTGSQSSTGSCMGVLRITASKAVPIFAGYPATSQPGTYYFEAAAPGGLCSALTVDPLGGGSYLSSSGFPTTQLP